MIAARTRITTIGDFRAADIAVGGQGAPLTSTFDVAMLRPRPGAGPRALQNIGGIGNVTFVSAEGAAVALDTGPGNMLMDAAAARAVPGLSCDRDGRLAAAGVVSQALLRVMLEHPYAWRGRAGERARAVVSCVVRARAGSRGATGARACSYFALPAPKTTGREMFGRAQFEAWAAAGDALGVTPVDLVATMTELTAVTIADAYARFAPPGLEEARAWPGVCGCRTQGASPPPPRAQVLVSGGGARNPTLMARLDAALGARLGGAASGAPRVVPHDGAGVPADAKEAMLFALLGYLGVCGLPGNVPSATGASRAVPLGKICPGDNFSALMRLLHG